ENVPRATQSLQHPRIAGDIDPGLPMSVLSSASTKAGGGAPPPAQLVAVEVKGAPGLEIYLDNQFRGRVLPSGLLVIENLKPGEHDLSIITPSALPITQKLSLTASKTILDTRGFKAASSSPLVAQINQALNNNNVRGALDLYQQLVRQSPQDPQ